MQILRPYTHDDRFLLEADLSLKGSVIFIEYWLSGSTEVFELPSTSQSWRAEEVHRALNLWENTCFEAFLQPVGQQKYYEFNFALNPAWNGFEFLRYREPQPLTLTQDFAIEKMEWQATQKRLSVQIENKTSYKNFNVGLTAVLLEKNQNKHYCSLAHKGPKPDFHLSENFTLLRKSN